MGRDKALLPFRGGTLAGYIASTVRAAAGSATLIGDPRKYGGLGYAVAADRNPGRGPLGGIDTALGLTAADWNLVVACDMPGISEDLLRGLLEAAEQAHADVLAPEGVSGRLEPLCAVYHRRCGAAVRRAVDSGVRRVTEALAGLAVATWNVTDSACFANLNTPEDWAHHDAQ
jgi:molybdenum cofactor guanylyltransferase